jgi:serine protease Do
MRWNKWTYRIIPLSLSQPEYYKEAVMDKKIKLKDKKKIALKSFMMTFAFIFMTMTMPAPYFTLDSCAAADKIPGSFSDLVKKVSPSVVNVSVVKTTRITQQFTSPYGENDPFNDFFNRFFNGQLPKNYRQRGIGTGFIIDKDGFILTNNHVVEGADEITVTLSNKIKFIARVIGRDSKTDLALIKIEGAKDLSPAVLGDSNKMEVGDWVVAIGDPFGLDNTVTAGIISAKYRRNIGTSSYEDYLQTDAAINPGNSGGPLVNTDGEVIGINSAIYSQSGGSVGIGFAIPINMAKELLPQLKKGKIIRGWLGVMIQAITPDLQTKLGLKSTKGALVADITDGSPGGKADLKTGDVITAFDGKEIVDSNDLPMIVAGTPVGKNVKIEILRNGDKKVLDAKIAELMETEEKTPSATGGEGDIKNELGFKAGDITPEMAEQFNLINKSGVIILEVENGSLAEEAGLQPGDIVVEIDKEKITTLNQFNKKIRTYKTGDTILFLVKREGSTIFLTLRVEK